MMQTSVCIACDCLVPGGVIVADHRSEDQRRIDLHKGAITRHGFNDLGVAKPCCSIDLIGDTSMRR